MIVFDKTINNKSLNLSDIKKIVELLVINKELNDYIDNIEFNSADNNCLGCYSNYKKSITIYTKTFEKMLHDVDNSIVNFNKFELLFYKNLLMLQVILHEVEHANQQKISYTKNSLEALIIRLSYLVDDGYNEKLYEYCPEERLAEIKSFDELNNLLNYSIRRKFTIVEVIKAEKLKRMLTGYYAIDHSVSVPLISYFSDGKVELLNTIKSLINTHKFLSLDDRFKFGFPISNQEYCDTMQKLILSFKKKK